MRRTTLDPSARHSRRAAVRLLGGCALAAPAVWRSPSALAIKGWCRRDPIVTIGDLTVQIVLISNAQMHGLATGPTRLVITVPAGIATGFLADDPGFGHHGYDVHFAESGNPAAGRNAIDVQVDAYAPAANKADGPLPLLVEFAPRGAGSNTVVRAEGLANEWIRLHASLTGLGVGAEANTPAAPILETTRRRKRKPGRGRK